MISSLIFVANILSCPVCVDQEHCRILVTVTSFCSGTFVNSRLLRWGQRSLIGLLIRSSDCSRFFGFVKTGGMNDSLDYRGSRNSSHGGGLDSTAAKAKSSPTPIQCEVPWAVSEDIFEYVTEGFLRGWGMSGSNVHLEIGTAIFARRTDVERWNNACVSQIERLYQDRLEAVAVHGYDPDISPQNRAPVGKRSAAPKGQQTPQVLRL